MEKEAIELAEQMLLQAQATETGKQKRVQQQLARMMEDPNGKVFTTSFTDQCFRSQRPARIADQLTYLLQKYGVPRYLSPYERFGMWAFQWLGTKIPSLFVPLVKRMVRKATANVILPGESRSLTKHMALRRKQGIRINLNHIGEAILGEGEAENRLQIYLDDLAKPDVEYISVKISSICSQINLLAWKETLNILAARLKQLYRAAESHQYVQVDGKKIPKFVNLDMEEYRDLHLTVELFRYVLDDPEFFHHSAGIVLQSYLPDSYEIQKKLTEWGKERVANGGAPIKIRIVKGANLAMEKVDASLHGWPQAPYLTKIETDANYKRMVRYGCEPINAQAAHLGIGSHNLFDIAYALLLRRKNGVEPFVCFEMLEGMADPLRHVVQTLSEDMLLYCPTATEEEFQNAIAYLIRRLDENTASENFLRVFFGLRPGSKEWEDQVILFSLACQKMDEVNTAPNRTQNRLQRAQKPTERSSFENEPDTDWSLPQNRQWPEKIMRSWSVQYYPEIPLMVGGEATVHPAHRGYGEDPSRPGKSFFHYSLASEEDIVRALETAKRSEKSWAATSPSERAHLLADVAQALREYRADLIGSMVANTGKTIPEADAEVSEAIDFVEYYRRNLIEITSMADLQWRSKGTVLVASPWNFSCSIPVGGIVAALAAGNCVIFKPASEAVLVGWQLVHIMWEAGISSEVLQFVTCEDEPIGSMLIKDTRINAVVLTGATATAKLFFKLHPGLDLMAETGGKNTLIITSLADRDLAIKDLVQSAFGYAGQKCSACSLAICEAEVYDDPHFREQLRDATASLVVGSAWNLATRLNPLIHTPNDVLMRGLTQLEPGEEWLLQPQQDPKNPNLWSPGIKLGVKPNSFTHQNELFGPVLGLMRANSLQEAVEIANGTPYGLTAGIHSLDEREQKYWTDHIEAGNCYINRGITGAIVQRQPFGGCKESSFGPGAKAGGPNYLMQMMRPQQASLPTSGVDLKEYPQVIQEMTRDVAKSCTAEQLKTWHASIGNYLFFWNYYFSKDHDPSRVLGQDNILRYVPQKQLLLRMNQHDSTLNILRALAAAIICGTPMELSAQRPLLKNISTAAWLEQVPHIKIIKESEAQLVQRIDDGKIKRIRLLSSGTQILQEACARKSCNLLVVPPSANGRVELVHYLREVSISRDYHRYGYLGDRELG